jgi:hypothetical protein
MDVMQADGTRKVHWYFTDQTGKEHTHRMRNVPVDFDVVVEMPKQQAIHDQRLLKRERQQIERDIEDGVAVADITRAHLTSRQAIRPLIRAFMRMPSSPGSVKVAEWVRDNVSNAILDVDLSPAIRTRIRTRITDLIAIKADLIADESRQEELE